jgi:hypothetical protein
LRDLFQSLIHALETDARRTHQKRKRHNRSRSDNSTPRKDDVYPQMFVQKLTESAAPAEQFQKKQAGCHWR